MDQRGGSQSPLEKWQLGMERLAKSKAEPALLGLAMSSIHGALEAQFRYMLASLPQLSRAERIRVNDVNQVKWRELRDLMQRCLGLNEQDASYIMRMNSIRNEAAHGGEFRGTYPEVAAYADFVKKWLDVSQEEWLDIAQREWSGANENGTIDDDPSFMGRCPRCSSTNIKSLEVIYHRGITVIERGRGTEVKQYGSSLQAAPPKKKKYLPEMNMPWWALFLILPVVFMLTSFLGFLLPVWFYWVWRYNTVEYPRLLATWRQTFQCERCAHTFPVTTLRA